MLKDVLIADTCFNVTKIILNSDFGIDYIFRQIVP